jgi:hypothetical protein
VECAPGEELQVDFGQGAWIEADGKRRRPHLFRAVLSHSRKGFLAQGGIYVLRALQGVVSVTKQHPVAALEQDAASAKRRGV